MLISVNLDPARARVWQSRLVQDLRNDGHQVSLSRADVPSAPAPAGCNLLMLLERMIYGQPAGASAPVELPDLFFENQRFADKPGLIFDLSGAPISGNSLQIPSIVPLYDGLPGEAAAMSAILAGRAPSITIARKTPSKASPELFAAGIPAIET